MTAPSSSSRADSTVTQDSFVGLFLRMFWMIAAYPLLFFLATGIYRKGPWAFSALDIAYVLVVALLLAARFVDIRSYRGLTSEGEPATMAHWRRFSLMTCIAGLLLWLAARGVALALRVG
ncbi:MAG: hypothetical protein A3K19_27790 [Lentisphaerae bacterium RIFOXYB12_FULL_65_16]|nr:MAG: hypothetical protein A3K18_30900 [Lentisphaerae bacterium RIFOXYA12_64_32]OGV90655.1 MAG: hypothetical protein A3K19_27790 [Lentisphaerae bacterium RIFOXYB12_FULL_65_16]